MGETVNGGKGEGGRTKDQRYLKRVNCPRCQKFLFRGRIIGEIQCSRCGYLYRGKAVDTSDRQEVKS